jgi:hypothetical protein
MDFSNLVSTAPDTCTVRSSPFAVRHSCDDDATVADNVEGVAGDTLVHHRDRHRGLVGWCSGR